MQWPGETRIFSPCWVCGVRVFKSVRSWTGQRGFYAWFCVTCDVTWCGPGQTDEAKEAVS